MRNLFILLCSLSVFQFSFSQKTQEIAFSDLDQKATWNEVLNVEQEAVIVDYSMALVSGPSLEAFPYSQKESNASLLTIQNKILSIQRGKNASILVAGLTYIIDGAIYRQENFILEVTDIPSSIFIASSK